MQIENKLPQFNDRKTLLVSTGRQRAKIYSAFKGSLKLEEEINIPVPKFSDKEGFFAQKSSRGGKNRTLRTGSVRERQKEYLENQFKNALTKIIKDLTKRRNDMQIYLYTPDYMKNIILDDMPKGLIKNIKQVYCGNYYSYHPFKLIKIIKDDQEAYWGRADPRKKEAKKLLDKTDKI
jgi:hypothetical protein